MGVYIAKRPIDGAVKIGFSKNIEKRIYQLSRDHKCTLTILRVLAGARKTEKWMHAKFAPHALGGEWFNFSEDMMSVKPPTIKEQTPIDNEKYVSVTIEIPESIRDELDSAAEPSRGNRSIVARQILNDWFEQRQKLGPNKIKTGALRK